jgi:hypothetical protein
MDVLKERGGGGIEVKKSGQFNNSSGTEREGTQRHDSK